MYAFLIVATPGMSKTFPDFALMTLPLKSKVTYFLITILSDFPLYTVPSMVIVEPGVAESINACTSAYLINPTSFTVKVILGMSTLPIMTLSS